MDLQALTEYVKDWVRRFLDHAHTGTDSQQLNIANLSGTASVTQGGTGVATETAHGVLLGQGTSPITATAVGATNTVLHGNTGADPSFSAVVEADITLADNTTNNASTSAHGFVKKLPNDATKFYDGTGNYSSPISFKTGTATHDVSSTATQNIAHGLGKVPAFIRIAALINTGNGIPSSYSHGTYNGTTTACVHADGNNNAGTDSGNIINMQGINNISNHVASATVTVDATNIVLAWSNANTPTGSLNIMWEAMG